MEGKTIDTNAPQGDEKKGESLPTDASDGDHPGKDLVALYCAACHSLEIVEQQKQTEAGWRYLLKWMEEEQGMARLPGADEAQIIAYLSDTFGAK